MIGYRKIVAFIAVLCVILLLASSRQLTEVGLVQLLETLIWAFFAANAAPATVKEARKLLP